MEEKTCDDLERLVTDPKKGDERFKANVKDLAFTLNEFWRWSVSDLVSNATRGRLAEFIVAKALGISTAGVRDEWRAYDLLIEPEGIKVEVKSAAYLQAWFQKKLSPISFLTPETHAFDPDTGKHALEAMRVADVYVFAVLAHENKRTLNPMYLDQWKFWVVPTSELNARMRSQYGITLPSLKDLAKSEDGINYADLRAEVLRQAPGNARQSGGLWKKRKRRAHS
jgi:hypothetical protein